MLCCERQFLIALFTSASLFRPTVHSITVSLESAMNSSVCVKLTLLLLTTVCTFAAAQQDATVPEDAWAASERAERETTERERVRGARAAEAYQQRLAHLRTAESRAQWDFGTPAPFQHMQWQPLPIDPMRELLQDPRMREEGVLRAADLGNLNTTKSYLFVLESLDEQCAIRQKVYQFIPITHTPLFPDESYVFLVLSTSKSALGEPRYNLGIMSAAPALALIFKLLTKGDPHISASNVALKSFSDDTYLDGTPIVRGQSATCFPPPSRTLRHLTDQLGDTFKWWRTQKASLDSWTIPTARVRHRLTPNGLNGHHRLTQSMQLIYGAMSSQHGQQQKIIVQNQDRLFKSFHELSKLSEKTHSIIEQ